jgi:hypothetical protein
MPTIQFSSRAAVLSIAAAISLIFPTPVNAGSTTEWTVSGTVLDSINGHPLSAVIEVPGTSIDPVVVGPDGQYSIDLPENEEFELLTIAVADGYPDTLVSVGPLTEDIVLDILLEPDLAECVAPGYYKDVTTYYSEMFDIDDGGYTTDAPGAPLPWEWGTPTDWPNECKVGSNCWGTNLSGDFNFSGHEVLHSTTIDLQAAAGADGLTLYWDQAWDLASHSFHAATVETRIDGVVDTVWQNNGTGSSGSWLRLDADVLPAAGITMTVRWILESSGAVSARPGVFVDNVQVRGFQCQFDQVPPSLHLTPLELDIQMFPDETVNETLVFANIGDELLEWAIEAKSDGTRRSVISDFSGYYDLSNWTLINSPADVGGLITDQPGPPVELYIVGGHEGIIGFTEFQITIPRAGEVSFDWGYEQPNFRFADAGYLLNDSYTSLAHTFDQVEHFEESATIAVEAGDVLGFRVQVHEGYSGPAEFGLTNFDGPVCETVDSIDWLAISPESGAVDGNDADNVSVQFDTTGLLPGTYEATLCVLSNDPLSPVILVPVVLTVQAPAWYTTITGQVDSLGYCNDDHQSGAGAAIEIAGSNQTFHINADADGEYFVQIDSGESPVDMTTSLPGHLNSVATGISLDPGGTESVNFDLSLDSPCARTNPQSIAVTVAEDGTAIEPLEIDNSEGAVALDWSIFLHEPTHVGQGSSPAPSGAFAIPVFSPTLNPSVGYVTLDALDPEAITILNDNVSGAYLWAGAFIDNDFSQQLILDSISNMLHAFDTLTGDVTQLGTIASPGAGPSWLSMSWDHATNTLYTVNWDGAIATLYTIDLMAMEATEVGVIDGPGLSPDAIVIAIAVAFDGRMYGLVLEDEVLVEIDKHSGAATVIGSLGVDLATDGQDMDFDHSSNVLYWARMPETGSQTEMMTINTETGSASYIGDIDGGSSLVAMSVAVPAPCATSDSVPWLEVVPDAGTTGPGSLDGVQIRIDADGLAQGTHHAQICMASNDAHRAMISVPVELEVANINPPAINLVPSSLSTSLEVDDSDTLVFSIGNQGDQRLDWSLDESAPGCTLPGWANVSPQSGSIDESNNMAVFVDFDATGLAPGSYGATVCIQNNDPATPLAELDLQMQVTEPPNPAPVLTAIDPESIEVGSSQFTLTAHGDQFVSDSVVRFDGADLGTTFVSATELTATVPATELTEAGGIDVTVFNPAPGGGESLAIEFLVTEHALAIYKVLIDAPDPIVAGSILEYRIEATNTGNVTLDNVVVTDSLISPPSNDCIELVVSDSCVLQGMYTVTAADMDNGVIVNTASAQADGVAPVDTVHELGVGDEIFDDRFESP